MTIATVSAVQRSRSTVEVSWSYLVAPTGLVEVERVDDGGAPIDLGALSGSLTTFTDSTIGAVAVGVEVEYTITDIDAVQAVKSAPITVNDPDVPLTYGPVNTLADTIRYTTLVAVKQAMNITDTVEDAAITQAIIAAEVQIDVHNEQSFPSTGDNPATAGIPNTISVWALDASVAVYKLRDSTAGGFDAGSDAWIGTIDIADQVRRALRRNPLALGYKIAWGVA